MGSNPLQSAARERNIDQQINASSGADINRFTWDLRLLAPNPIIATGQLIEVDLNALERSAEQAGIPSSG